MDFCYNKRIQVVYTVHFSTHIDIFEEKTFLKGVKQSQFFNK